MRTRCPSTIFVAADDRFASHHTSRARGAHERGVTVYAGSHPLATVPDPRPMA